MLVKLAYGKKRLPIDFPDEWQVDVIEPNFIPALPDPPAALQSALRAPIDSRPLADLVNAEDKVGIVFSDITRPTPNHLLIPAVLAELDHVPAENVVLFNALGTHRANTDSELRTMLGADIVDSYRIVQNDAFDSNCLRYMGRSSFGHPVWLNRELVDCDFVVLTGFIEPHFFAGFSGGGKAVMPGMAGQETVLGNHDAGMIAHPNATWGITESNPIWEEIREVAHLLKRAFLLNVALNKDKQISAVFAGDLDAAHQAGCDFVRETAMVPVPDLYDIVITSNSGYPLDLNLYQSVKGMSAAAKIVRPGGTIIIAADCWDGIPDHGLYGELLRQADTPQALLEAINSPGFLKQDQWQAQIQAQIQLRADVFVYSDNLTVDQLSQALLKSSHDIVATTEERRKIHGPQVRVCVLTEGPQTIPFVAG